jgi:hypothetical protein
LSAYSMRGMPFRGRSGEAFCDIALNRNRKPATTAPVVTVPLGRLRSRLALLRQAVARFGLRIGSGTRRMRQIRMVRPTIDQRFRRNSGFASAARASWRVFDSNPLLPC